MAEENDMIKIGEAMLVIKPNKATTSAVRGKGRTSSRTFNALLPELRARAFAVSGVST